MSSRGLYIITDKGIHDYYYSHTGGTVDQALALLAITSQQKDDTHCATPSRKLLEQIDRALTESANPDKFLNPLDESSAATLLESFGSKPTIAAAIDLDFDNQIAKIEHNPLCFRKPPMDFSIEMAKGIACYQQVKKEAMDSHSDDPGGFMEQRIPELISEVLQQNSADEQPEQSVDEPDEMQSADEPEENSGMEIQ